ncbi:hypothetical protein PT974_01915 [Cladobotryum mycophilum]|uniref:U1-C C2H2-type zinc finger domain-containing protein n=1 Tax=Cladobotryum mycophilum TaxID=491253 RepID=A0ABR0SWQ0_9HYPO
MSEYWKSTPKYWCKHCSCYVRDTKLERQNHEATGKHQGALKRSLRDLHRNHEREGREKERAQREIARLNGVVSGSASSSAGPSSSDARNAPSTKPSAPSESQLKAQREQLAALGVSIPSDFRPEMAMPGEWTVTSTRVIEGTDEHNGGTKVEGRATGIRKREETEEQKEEEDAVRGLFKKPRRWGRDSRTMPQEEDQELDALLSGTMPLKQQADDESDIKKEEDNDKSAVKKEEEDIPVKEEPDTESQGLTEAIKPKDEPGLDLPVKAEEEDRPGIAPVVFKKRKPKGIRSK